MSRYTDRERYFNELAETSRKYYLDYLSGFTSIDDSCRVLEIGCGEGGNLLPFAEAGCKVVGFDLAPNKIVNAQKFFSDRSVEGEFYCADFLSDETPWQGMFDIIIIHDVIEHIEPEMKNEFFKRIKNYLNNGGIVFFAFPAWQMPFGGHQQICKSRFSRIPFIHLLPSGLYRSYLNLFKENPEQIEELISIKRSKMTVGLFESLADKYGYEVKDRTLWFINPHYEIKFNLKPRKLYRWIGKIPFVRNFFSTSCHYLLTV